MRTWNLGLNDPYQLIVAADSRFCENQYTNDHIYEIRLDGGEPTALALYTTFGLRARSLRVFPRFMQGDKTLTNPLDFQRQPKIMRLYPNFLDIQYAPFGQIDVLTEYWAISSQVIGGRIKFSNPSVVREVFTFEWNGLLSPLGQGSAMAVSEMGMHNVLVGESDGLHILCFLTGAPQSGEGPYAGLSLEIDLNPGDSRQISWVLTAQPDLQTAYDLARQESARAWDAELARIELTNQSESIQITTGDPEWDAVFMLAQRTANQLIFPASEALPNPSFVMTRQPDNGFSMRGDGSDYNTLWNGQTALDALYLSDILLPTRADLVRGFVDNFFVSINENGFIDWKPGLKGQRAGRLAQPLLAHLAWLAYEVSADETWLGNVFPNLLSFFKYWLGKDNDRDQDNFPECSHPYQLGLDETPLFSLLHECMHGVETSAIETPALAVMLFQEARALYKMAMVLNFEQDCDWLDLQINRLRAVVEETWDDGVYSYLHRDAHTHTSHKGETLVVLTEPGKYPLTHEFVNPQRLQLRLVTHEEITRRTHIKLSGKNGQKRVIEDIPPRAIQWLHGIGRYTSQNHFTSLKEVTIKGMAIGETCQIGTIDFSLEDISLLLPLWTGIPSPQRAKKMIDHTILARYQQHYGLPVCPQGRPEKCADTQFLVRLPWNSLILEGLLHYQYRKEAAVLFDGVMHAVIQTYHSDHACRATYHAMSGIGSGERNILTGLAPVGLFLKILGLQKISTKKIIVHGFNPFSWPVTVQYLGSKIEFFSDNTQITFRGRQPVVISGDGPFEISLD
jgi:hypothetical protein